MTDLTARSITPPLTIVGIGASAGGLEAFRAFFAAMPPESGMAFVVVLHLPRGRKSMLPDILGRWTAMPVAEAEDGALVEPNHVYVPPPHALTTLCDGRLRIQMPGEGDLPDYHPIDGFFDSLALQLRENAVGIVLSGTGNDGALGLKAIKEHGGLTVAQGPGTAAAEGGGSSGGPQYADMPSGAIATGVVDLVAAAEAMPGHLLRMNRARQSKIAVSAESWPEDVEAIRLEICDLLRTTLGHDFSGYKDKTFLRRVSRRMQVVGSPSLRAYVVQLAQDRDECVLLFRDLLIRVTSFFRDSAAFDAIEATVLPRLFAGKHADATVRVWVPGCATGEEAYSLAILLREYTQTLESPPKVQVFATDIDEPAIAIARLGRYPTSLLEGLSTLRLNRFFTRSGSSYIVNKEIRALCTFSPHSLVRDPPFSRMDLVSCRNLLIYLNSEAQNAVMPAFHYALSPGGILLLGSSESNARHEDLFEPLDKASRIFLRRDVPSPRWRLPQVASAAPAAGPATHDQPARRTDRRLAADGPVPRGGNQLRPGKAAAASMHLGDPSVTTPPHGMRGRLGASLRRLFPVIADLQRLREELQRTHEALDAVTEEHGTAVEELRSANEELHSVNEELQSSNEELETSKEEIQSVNEELHTVNLQLTAKVDELDRANSDLRNLFASTDIATVFLDRNLIIRGFTPAVGSIYNLIQSDEGRPLTDIACRIAYDRLPEDVARVLETLQPLERRVARVDGSAHYVLRLLPYRTPDGTVSGTLLTFVDVTSLTAMVAAEQHQRLLVDELNHRVRNILAVVISLASQTLRRSETLADFTAAFQGRLHSLTASYTLLTRENWAAVPLRDVLTEETRPYMARDQTNIIMRGPDVRLAASGALAVGMAIHELATNAVKYGALSVADGTVTLTWRFESLQDAEGDSEDLVLEWIETGGPAVSPPHRRGFGTTLIERGFAHALGGTARISFEPAGVRAVLRAPVGVEVFLDTALATASAA